MRSHPSPMSPSWVTEGAAAFLERERTLLPDGELTQPFVTRLAVVRMAH